MLSLAAIYRERKDWLKARQLLGRAAPSWTSPDERVRLLIEAAEICAGQLDDEAQAGELYDEAIAIDPTRTDVVDRLAAIRFRRGDWSGLLPLAEFLVAKAEGPPSSAPAPEPAPVAAGAATEVAGRPRPRRRAAHRRAPTVEGAPVGGGARPRSRRRRSLLRPRSRPSRPSHRPSGRGSGTSSPARARRPAISPGRGGLPGVARRAEPEGPGALAPHRDFAALSFRLESWADAAAGYEALARRSRRVAATERNGATPTNASGSAYLRAGEPARALPPLEKALAIEPRRRRAARDAARGGQGGRRRRRDRASHPGAAGRHGGPDGEARAARDGRHHSPRSPPRSAAGDRRLPRRARGLARRAVDHAPPARAAVRDQAVEGVGAAAHAARGADRARAPGPLLRRGRKHPVRGARRRAGGDRRLRARARRRPDRPEVASSASTSWSPPRATGRRRPAATGGRSSAWGPTWRPTSARRCSRSGKGWGRSTAPGSRTIPSAIAAFEVAAGLDPGVDRAAPDPRRALPPGRPRKLPEGGGRAPRHPPARGDRRRDGRRASRSCCGSTSRWARSTSRTRSRRCWCCSAGPTPTSARSTSSTGRAA